MQQKYLSIFYAVVTERSVKRKREMKGVRDREERRRSCPF
jgi:hypothetical protein